MSGTNIAIIVGNLGRDPEVKYTKDNRPVVNFSVATTESWKDKTGQWQEETEWHRIVCFGYAAEKAQGFTKGKQVYLMGKIQTRKWQGQDGQDRYTTEIVVRQSSSIYLTGRKEEGGRPAGVGESGHFEPPEAPPVHDDEDDLPF